MIVDLVLVGVGLKVIVGADPASGPSEYPGRPRLRRPAP